MKNRAILALLCLMTACILAVPCAFAEEPVVEYSDPVRLPWGNLSASTVSGFTGIGIVTYTAAEGETIPFMVRPAANPLGNVQLSEGQVLTAFRLGANDSAWRPALLTVQATLNRIYSFGEGQEPALFQIPSEGDPQRIPAAFDLVGRSVFGFTAQIPGLGAYAICAVTKTEEAPAPVERRVTVSTDIGEAIGLGDPITLTAHLEGFEGDSDVTVVWEADKGEGWQEVGTGLTYQYAAAADSLTWLFRAKVLFTPASN
jgi:hypothetical protein